MIRWKRLILVAAAIFASGFVAGDVADELFAIRKDSLSPWSQVMVALPRRHPLYQSFAAKIRDVTENIPDEIRDSNKTYVASDDSPYAIRIHALLPGHRYSIAIFGQKDGESSLIKEESMVMDPRAPDFRSASSEIQIGEHNITMRTMKNATHLQDSFSIEYRQTRPDRKFPILQILDVVEQRTLEFYLGNLAAGHEYSVRVTAHKDGMSSRPWISTLVTRPAPLAALNLTQTASSGGCVDATWQFEDDIETTGGADFVALQYGLLQDDGKTQANVTNMTIPYTETSISICDTMVPGEAYRVSGAVLKGAQSSTRLVIEQRLRPLPPIDFRVRADLKRGKYKLLAELPVSSRIDTCHIMVAGDDVERTSNEANVEQTKSGHRICWHNFALSPGERFDFSISSMSNTTASQKLQKSIVLAPAFDFNAFGLSLQESANGTIELAWPKSDVFMTRVKDIWSKVVGADSTLEMRVTPVGAVDGVKSRRFDTSPKSMRTIEVDGLAKGACYRIQLYTLTKTGIISETRHNETIRMSSPSVNVSLESVTRSSATLRVATASIDATSIATCQMHIVVRDMDGKSVYDRRQPLVANFSPLLNLDGLRSFHKYTVNTQIICGSNEATICPPATRTMRQLSFATRQDRPGPVQSVRVETLNAHSVVLTWLPPALPNGILTHYVVNVTKMDSDEIRTIDVAADGVVSNRTDHAVELIVDELFGGNTYTFGVRAVTEAGLGELVTPSSSSRGGGSGAISMPLQAPPRPAQAPDVMKESVGVSRIVVRFPTSVFDARNGAIRQYAVIVSEVAKEEEVNRWLDADNGTYTWTQVQRFDVWPSYVAVLRDVHNIKQDEDVSIFEEIGDDENCGDISRADRICNGPLRPAARFRVRIRLFTAPNLFTDSPSSQIVTTGSVSPSLPLFTLIAVLIVVSFTGIVATAFLFYWTRSKKARLAQFKGAHSPKDDKESQWAALKMMMAERAADCLAKLGLDSTTTTTTTSTAATSPSSTSPVTVIHNTSVDGGIASNNHLGAHQHRRTRSLRERTGVEHRLERLSSGPNLRTPLYTVITGVNTNKTRPVRIADFEDHVRMMSADSDFRFSEEYEMMKNVGVGQSQHASELAINRPKNRFTNILPYDHSRVRISSSMTSVEGADYINANYMPGFSSRREFIAAQGPLPTTRDAFWQMTWEQQCPAIIALTKCVEKGRDKCHQYWPDAENATVAYGEIEVTLLGETHYDEFIIRDLRLERLNNDGARVTRVVRHWHYMAWPDFGVPQHPHGIIGFARMFRRDLPHSPHNMPTIVHCSAGVGRSGTFIAIDRLLQTITLDEPLDVFGIVCEMRYERCQMVQNEQQYIFIHVCLLHALNQLRSTSSGTTSPHSSTNGAHHNGAYVQDSSIIAESGF